MILNLLSAESRKCCFILLDCAHVCMLRIKPSQILNGSLQLVQLECGVLCGSTSVRCPVLAISLLGLNSSHLTWGVNAWCLGAIESLSLCGKGWTPPESFLNSSGKALLCSGPVRNLMSYHLESRVGCDSNIDLVHFEWGRMILCLLKFPEYSPCINIRKARNQKENLII